MTITLDFSLILIVHRGLPSSRSFFSRSNKFSFKFGQKVFKNKFAFFWRSAFDKHSFYFFPLPNTLFVNLQTVKQAFDFLFHEIFKNFELDGSIILQNVSLRCTVVELWACYLSEYNSIVSLGIYYDIFQTAIPFVINAKEKKKTIFRVHFCILF